MNRFRLLPSVAIAATLGACGGEVSPEISEQGGVPVECALDGAESFSTVCMLQFVEGTDKFVIRHPDGGFRRFESDPGGGWQLADGAEALTGKFGFDVDYVEFEVDRDRYAMPLSLLPERRND